VAACEPTTVASQRPSAIAIKTLERMSLPNLIGRTSFSLVQFLKT
jgi:hypothetical protein